MTKETRRLITKIAIAFGCSVALGMAFEHFVLARAEREISLSRALMIKDASDWAYLNANRDEAKKVLRVRIDFLEACLSDRVGGSCGEASPGTPYLMMANLHDEDSSERAEWEAKATARCRETGKTDCMAVARAAIVTVR